jgi:hypothetical protein
MGRAELRGNPEVRGVRAYPVPQKSGEVRCWPSPLLYPEHLEANRRLLEGSRLRLAGRPLVDLRHQMRRDMGFDPQQPLVASGHQPVFVHPGVAMRAFLLAEGARRQGWAAAFVAVDSDLALDLGAFVPALAQGDLAVARVALLDPQERRALEGLPAPGPARWEGFAHRIRAHLEEVGLGAALQRASAFFDGGRDLLSRVAGAVDFMEALRRLWEPPENPAWIPLSRLCSGAPFAHFCAALLAEAEAFAGHYNAVLRDYRRARRLRSPAHPFPDLRRQEEAVEAPFWWLSPRGERASVWVSRRRGRLELSCQGALLAALPLQPSRAAREIQSAGLRLRPRALTLTLFLRLLGCDLFLHGTGGAAYDRVTDEVLRRHFGLPPPALAVATGTLHLPLAGPHGMAAEVRRLRLALRELRYNPQRLAFPGPQAAGLAARKRLLIDLLAREPRGARRRALTLELHEVNAALAALEPCRRRCLEDELEAARAGMAREAVGRFREYAYFLFSAEDCRRLAEKAFQESGR